MSGRKELRGFEAALDDEAVADFYGGLARPIWVPCRIVSLDEIHERYGHLVRGPAPADAGWEPAPPSALEELLAAEIARYLAQYWRDDPKAAPPAKEPRH